MAREGQIAAAERRDVGPELGQMAQRDVEERIGNAAVGVRKVERREVERVAELLQLLVERDARQGDAVPSADEVGRRILKHVPAHGALGRHQTTQILVRRQRERVVDVDPHVVVARDGVDAAGGLQPGENPPHAVGQLRGADVDQIAAEEHHVGLQGVECRHQSA